MKLWIPLVTGIATCLLLTLLFGEYGVFNQQQLRSYRNRLDAHVAMLEARRGQLETEEELLRQNKARIRIEARAFGYLEPEERLLRIDGAEKRERKAWVAGSVIHPGKELPDHSGAIRAISMCAGLLAFILLLGREPAKKRSRPRPKEQEESYSIRRASM